MSQIHSQTATDSTIDDCDGIIVVDKYSIANALGMYPCVQRIVYELNKLKRKCIRTKHIVSVSNCMRFICLREPVGLDAQYDKLPIKLVNLIHQYRHLIRFQIGYRDQAHFTDVGIEEWNKWVCVFGEEFGNEFRDYPKIPKNLEQSVLPAVPVYKSS